jgi:hypothetical protein
VNSIALLHLAEKDHHSTGQRTRSLGTILYAESRRGPAAQAASWFVLLALAACGRPTTWRITPLAMEKEAASSAAILGFFRNRN